MRRKITALLFTSIFFAAPAFSQAPVTTVFPKTDTKIKQDTSSHRFTNFIKKIPPISWFTRHKIDTVKNKPKNNTESTSIQKKLKSSGTNFIKKIPPICWFVKHKSDSAKNTLRKEIKLSSIKRKFKLSGTATGISGYRGGDNDIYGTNGFYNEVDINPSFTLFNLPVTTGIQLLKPGTGLPTKIPAFNISFDYNKYLLNLKTSYINQIEKEKNDYIRSLLPPGVVSIEDSLKKEESMKGKIMNEHSFEVLLRHQYVKDSLQKKNGHLTPEDSARINSLDKTIKELQKLQKCYDQLVKLKQQYYNVLVNSKGPLAKFDALESKVKSAGSVNELVGIFHQKLPAKQTKQLSFLSSVKRFDIGASTLDYSDITVRHFPIIGLSTAFQRSSWYASFSAGKQQTPIFQTLFNTSFPSPPKENILYLNGGIGQMDKSHSQLSLSMIHSYAGAGTLSIAGKTNYILSFEKQQQFSDWLKLKGEAAKSYLVFDNGSTSGLINEQAPGKISDYAFDASAEATLKKIKSIIKLDVNKIGKDYYTMGNPYLLNNSTSIGLSIKSNFYKGKITMDHQVTNTYLASNANMPGFTNSLTARSLVAWNISKFIQFRVQYSPMVYYSGNPIGKNWQAGSVSHNGNSGLQTQYHLGHCQFTSSLIAAITESEYNKDTLKSQSHFASLTLTQGIHFSKQTITLSASDNQTTYGVGLLKYQNYSLQDEFQVSKVLTIKLGITDMHQQFPKTDLVGGIAGVKIRILKFLTWGIDGNYNTGSGFATSPGSGNFYFIKNSLLLKY